MTAPRLTPIQIQSLRLMLYFHPTPVRAGVAHSANVISASTGSSLVRHGLARKVASPHRHYDPRGSYYVLTDPGLDRARDESERALAVEVLA